MTLYTVADNSGCLRYPFFAELPIWDNGVENRIALAAMKSV